jgi:hypothetical protein
MGPVVSYDDPNPHTRNTRAKPVKVSASPEHIAALALQLGLLARMEESDPTYGEMCAAATAKKMGA